MLAKCVLRILEFNNIGTSVSEEKKKKLNICHMLTSSTQLQNRSFHVVERTRTSAKCPKMKSAQAKHAKLLLFIMSNMQIFGTQ